MAKINVETNPISANSIEEPWVVQIDIGETKIED